MGCLVITSVTLAILPSQAGTVTYLGSGSLSGTTTSWDTGARPTTSDEALFTGTLPETITTAAGTNLEFGNFIWNSNSSSTVAISSTGTSSAQVRLSNGGGSTAAIANGGAEGDLLVLGTNATSNTLILSGNLLAGTGNLEIFLQANGNINVVNAGATLDIATRLRERTNGTTSVFGFTKTGAGTLILRGSNTYTGTTVLEEGTLGLRNSNALSSGALTINGGILASMVSPRTISNNVTVGGSFTLGGASQALTLNGTMDLGGTVRSITLDNSATIGGIISSGGLTKLGSAMLTLSAANEYTGATTVSNGILAVSSTGSISNNSAVTVGAGGNFRYNASTAYTGTFTLESGGTVSGTNLTGSLGGLTIGSGQTISPGNSPGNATTASQTWAGGGTYKWEINSTAGAAGQDPGWDLITGTGTLDITAALGSQFTIAVTSLGLNNLAGGVSDFDQALSYNWLIADFLTLSNFSESAFIIDTTGFANSFSGGFGVTLGTGVLDGDDSQIYLTYTAIPEPGGALLASLGLLVLLRRRATR